MIEGIVVCVVLVLALIGLHLWNKPKPEAIQVLPEVETPLPIPAVKPARQVKSMPAFEAEYGKKTDWGKAAREAREEQERRQRTREQEERAARLRRRRQEEEEDQRRRVDDYNYDSTGDLLTTAVTAAAAVVIADTLYDSFVDTSPAQTYSSPEPSSYESSSSWGGDSYSSSSYDSSSSSSSDSSSW